MAQPRKPRPSPPEGKPPSPSASGPAEDARSYQVLIVEDNRDAAESLRTLLELGGYTGEVAGDGATALARSFQPEVVLCDIGLPGEMDGYAVATALSQGGDRRPYRIALSGYGQPRTASGRGRRASTGT